MELKIAVISDLHCRHSKSDTETNTFLFSDLMRLPVKQNPAQSLITHLQKDKGTQADIIICPGDITNKTDPQGLITGWSYLEEIKDAFKARYIISTLGNHDVDSRKLFNRYDAFNMPQRLKDNFPFPFEKEKDQYFSKKFCIIEIDDILILNFNSAHSHTNEKDCLTSIITDEILENIDEKLQFYSQKNHKFKIALTHHHPLKHANIGSLYKDSDVIEKGDLLLQLIEKYNFQILIHGHKHIPRLTYFNSLPILGSGSFSSLMNLLPTGSKNMFHLITLNSDSRNGKIQTFEFTNGLGWTDKYNSSHFPSITGFGNREDVNNISESIFNFYTKKNQEYLKFTELIHQFPELEFLIPTDLNKLKQSIKTKGLLFYPDDNNLPDQITKI
jgi:3',5'-cyclic AMP phosphodiesterase CpdA